MMRKLGTLAIAALLALLGACVTINVYFPAAAAEKAAEQFIDEVIGAPSSSAPEPGREGAWLERLSPIGTAHAQADLSIDTPAIRAIQQRMADRFAAQLAAHFDAGALGLTRDGKVAVRDAGAVPLAQRAALTEAVAAENRDRDAVYREIAVANGHPDWEADIRSTFAAQWVEKARDGWWYQDASGAWKQK